MMRLSFLLAILFVFNLLPLWAQPPTVAVSADTKQMQIGDALTLSIEANCSANEQFVWPQIPDTLGRFEVTAVSKPDTVKDQSGQLTIKQMLTLTTFEPGDFVVPSFTFSYRNTQSGAGGTIRSNPISIKVTEPEVDAQSDIKDIAPPIDLPLTAWERLRPYFLALLVLLVIGLLWFLWKRFSKRSETKVVQPDVPQLPPYEIALNRLKQLEQAKYWQQGDEKMYYSELTDILRQYIENRYKVQAPELTTDETIAAFRSIVIEPSVLDKLHKLLTLADLVKFAKAKPMVEQHLQAFADAGYFVRATKPAEEVLPETSENPI